MASGRVRRQGSDSAARAWLRGALQRHLYRHFHCTGGATRPVADPPRSRLATARLRRALSEANAGTGYWSSGWTIEAVDGDDLLVTRDALRVMVPAHACRAVPPFALAPGGAVEIHRSKESFSGAPGFYLAAGNLPLESGAGRGLLRTYWNLTPAGARRLMERVTRELNDREIPFRLKVLEDPALFSRCDPVVLYFLQPDFARALPLLTSFHRHVAEELRPAVPALTWPLAPGVGLAEDPGGQSFGMHRCGLVAEGLVRAFEQGRRRTEDRLLVVEEHLRQEGLSPTAPYLNPGSTTSYPVFPILPGRARRAVLDEEKRERRYLEAAHRIGRRLTEDAIWWGDRCTWLGSTPLHEPTPGASRPATVSVLGPELYAGCSGVALFLTELYGATGDETLRSTARAALQQSLARLDTFAPRFRIGFFTGWVGILYALARAGLILREDGLQVEVGRLLRPVVETRPDDEEPDVIAGRAGAILGLLALEPILAESRCLDFAEQLGVSLVRQADRSNLGFSWASPGSPGQRNLTGFSHGAAGVGLALLELFARTGNPDFQEAASEAFRYERHWFDRSVGNWTDLRRIPRGKRAAGGTPAGASWCHGAPGIALSRWRAHLLTRLPLYRVEAETAVDTTERAIRSDLDGRSRNFSLCHGLAGNAEVLRRTRGMSDGPTASDGGLVDEVAQVGIDRYLTSPETFPCGAGAGSTPSLMLGLAGIGYFYLGLARPGLPCILALEPGLPGKIPEHGIEAIRSEAPLLPVAEPAS